MRFNEFVNRNKNIIGASNSKRISESIEITEDRNKFYSGELFQKYDMVESDGKTYRILEQCSNYFQVVDAMGNLSRKFPKNLTIVEDVSSPTQFSTSHVSFHGYEPTDVFQESAAAAPFADTIRRVGEGKINDDIAVLKALKSVDAMVNHVQDFLNSHTHEDQTQYNAHVMSHFAIARECLTKIGEYIHHEDYLEQFLSLLQTAEAPNMSESTEYQPKDKLTVAKIIADAVGIPHDMVSTPDNLVNAAIRKAKKDPVLMKNKALLQNMIQIAKDVGIKVMDTTFDVKESIEEALTYQQKLHHIRVDPTKGTPKDRLGKIGEFGAGKDLSDDEHYKNAMAAAHAYGKDKFAGHYEVTHVDAYNHKIRGGSVDKVRKQMKSSVSKKNESVELEELSTDTLRSYADKATQSASKLVAQGSKAKKLDTAYAKMTKATKRFASVANAKKKMTEDTENNPNDYDLEKNVMGYHELKRKLETMSGIKDISKEPAEAPKDAEETQANDPSGPSDLPHGHSLHPSSETHRKQLIKKLKGV